MGRLLFFLLVFSVFSCVPKEEEKTYTNIELSIDNQEVRKLLDLQDRQLIDSIVPYLSHIDPSFRYLAGRAFASQGNDKYLPELSKLLKDTLIDNKAIAAYSLGQSFNNQVVSALTSAFIQQDTSISVNNILNKNILESIGKTGDKSLLKFIVEANYLPTDKLLMLGQIQAIYQFALRGISTEEGTKKMVDYAIESHINDEARVLASAYLSRTKNIDINPYKFRLLKRFLKEDNLFVKANLATVLGHAKDPEVMNIFISELKREGDYKVKINMVKSLVNFPYINTIEPILDLLDDQNIHVALTAAQVLEKHGNKYDAGIYQQYISSKNHFSVNAQIYKAVAHHLAKGSSRSGIIAKRISTAITNSKSDEEKMAYIRVFAELPRQYKMVLTLLDNATFPIKTAVFESLTKLYSTSTSNVKKVLLQRVKQEMEKGDAAIIAIGAGFIKDNKSEVNKILGSDMKWMNDLLPKLVLPKEIESYNEVLKAVASINDTNYEPKLLDFQNPIDWSSLNGISDSTRCTISTDKGEITIELYPIHAPGTVANFIKLVREGFYANKSFHRVVSNFVVQVGCPRGDGYGGKDYSIRSEFGDKYYNDEGYVGMASAGKNTESTQWFITHRPTPHLDGKYTIFGKVTNGMNIVHNLIQGDHIKGIVIH